MPLGGRKCLGLALEERRILAAEVSVSGGKAVLQRAEEFLFPEGESLDDPRRLGQAFRAFLRERHFSASCAVLGVPARWVAAREKRFPPAEPRALAEMARLEMERTFATAADQLVGDFAGIGDTGQNGPHLLAAIPRSRLAQATALAQGAGLRLKAVTPTATALAESLQAEGSGALLLLLQPGHAEAAVVRKARTRALKSLPLPPWPGAATSQQAERPNEEAPWPPQKNADDAPNEVAPPARVPPNEETALAFRRALVLSLTPLAEASDNGAEAPAPLELFAWDGLDMGEGALQEISDAIGTRARASLRMTDLDLHASAAESECGARFLGAAALALRGARGESLTLDFLHSHLEQPKDTRLARRIGWAAAAVLSALLVGTLLLMEWRREEADLQALQSRLEALGPDVEAAEAVVERVMLAREWTDQRPRFLDPLRELAYAFPEEDPIWATSLAMREDMRIALTGSAANERLVLDLLDRIRNRPAFSNVKLQYMRAGTGSSRDVAFSLTFDYLKEG